MKDLPDNAVTRMPIKAQRAEAESLAETIYELESKLMSARSVHHKRQLWIALAEQGQEPKIETVTVKIASCKKCPNLKTERFYTADSWEHVIKWFCGKTDRPKSGSSDKCGHIADSSDLAYVELVSEEPKKIPDWCPLR
jgi:hypothetical protein